MKDKIGMMLSILFLVGMIIGLALMINKFVSMYQDYEIQGDSFTIVCDEVKMNVNNNDYVCSNDIYTYNFKSSNILDLDKEYNIEVYYYKTHWVEWLDWTRATRERQSRKIVERSD